MLAPLVTCRAGSLARQVTKGANSWSFSQVAWAVRCWWLRHPQQSRVPSGCGSDAAPSLSPGRREKTGNGTLTGEAVAGPQDLGVLAPTGQKRSFGSERHFRAKRCWPRQEQSPQPLSPPLQLTQKGAASPSLAMTGPRGSVPG